MNVLRQTAEAYELLLMLVGLTPRALLGPLRYLTIVIPLAYTAVGVES